MHDLALRPQHLNLISLCTGGAGLDLGVELAIPDARSVCMVEREGFAVATLVSAMEAGLMAPAPIWSDARTFRGREWRGCVDGVIGGIPCQPHSEAGKRLGEEDERDLWSDARRIIVQSGAWWCLIENVRGMLFSGGAERVFTDLRRMGFAVEGGLFTASEVEATHRRERLFILGVADSASRGRWCGPGATGHGAAELVAIDGGRSLADAQRDGRGQGSEVLRARGGQSEPAVRGQAVDGDRRVISIGGYIRNGKYRVSNVFPPGPAELERWRHILQRRPDLEPALRRVGHGVGTTMDTDRVERLRMLGNGVVPLQAAYALRTLGHRLAARGSAGAAQLVRMML